MDLTGNSTVPWLIWDPLDPRYPPPPDLFSPPEAEAR